MVPLAFLKPLIFKMHKRIQVTGENNLIIKIGNKGDILSCTLNNSKVVINIS